MAHEEPTALRGMTSLAIPDVAISEHCSGAVPGRALEDFARIMALTICVQGLK